MGNMVSGTSLKIKYLLLWVALSLALLVFLHLLLEWPWMALSNVILTGLICGLPLIWQKSFSRLLLITEVWFLFLALFSAWHFQILWAILPVLILAALFLFYFQRSLLLTEKSILTGLEQAQKGASSRSLKVLYEDERGAVIQELNRLNAYLKEKELLNQYIAPEVFRELQQESAQSSQHAQEKQMVIFLVYLDFSGSLNDAETFLQQASHYCRRYFAFLNHIDRQRAEILFFEETEGFEKNALLCLSEMTLSEWGQKRNCRGFLSQSLVKTGVLRMTEGFRFRVFCQTFEQNFEFLARSSAGAYIHQNFQERAERVFHLENHADKIMRVCGEKDLEFHLANLKSPRVEDKLISIKVIAAHQAEIGLEPLIELLQDVSPRVRIAATKSIGRLAQARNIDLIGKALLDSLKKEWNHDCRATIVIALGDLKRKDLVSPLFELLQDENDRVRANAIEAVGKCMERSVVLGHLEDMLKDKNNRARANAALALWLMGSRKGLKELLQMASSEEPLLCASGLYGLGEVFNDSNLQIVYPYIHEPLQFYLKEREELFIPSLNLAVQGLEKNHPMVIRNAILALQKLRSKSAVPALLKKHVQADLELKNKIETCLLAMEEYSLVSELRKAS